MTRDVLPAVRFDPLPSRTGNARAITLTYVLALALVAGISICSNLITQHIVRQQASTARVVNLAGRQRMLSQRTARIAEEMAAGTIDPAKGRQILLSSAAGIEHAENALSHGSDALGIPPPTAAAIRTLYAEPPYQLELRLQLFVRSARAVAAKPRISSSDPDLRAIVDNLETSLLPGLEHAVWQYQQDSEASIVRLGRIIGLLTWLMLAVLALEALLIFRPLFRRLTQSIQQLLQASTTDVLTHVLHRDAFLQYAEAELTRAQHAGSSTALILADLDHFRQVNERHGSAAGDLALRHFAAIAQTNLRSNDRIGRVSGGAFAILLCGPALEGAVLAAERIRERLAGSTAALMPDNFRVFVTCSFGVTVATGDDTVATLLTRAEATLNQAKTGGRNRVEASPPLALYPTILDTAGTFGERSTA